MVGGEKLISKRGSKMFLCIKKTLEVGAVPGAASADGESRPRGIALGAGAAQRLCPPRPPPLGGSEPAWRFLFAARHGVVWRGMVRTRCCRRCRARPAGVVSAAAVAAWPAAAGMAVPQRCTHGGIPAGNTGLALET